MSDLAGLGEPRLRSPSPGRGGRFDDGDRRSPLPSDRTLGPGDRAASGPQASSHRGRSAEFARKRRRDESPPSRDRYIPNYEREPYRERDRRDQAYSLYDHDRAGPPGRHGPNVDLFDDPYRRGGSGYRDGMFPYSSDRSISTRGGNSYSRSLLTPPSELPYLVTFRYFADFMRSTSPHIADDKDKLAEQWKRYRQDHTRKQLVTFFDENKSKAWFREKYQPGAEFDELRERLKKKGREGKIDRFMSRLQSGDLDILNYDYAPAKKKVSNPKLSTDATDDLGTPTAKADHDPNPISTLPPASGQDDENKPSIPPIKADSEVVEPEASKIKSESESETKNEINMNHLDAEAEDDEEPDDEFSASLAEALSGPNTTLGPSSALGNLIGESMRGKSGSDDIVILPPSDNQLFIKSISPDISRTELENHCKQVEGFDYLALSDPHTGKKLHRVGWVSFLPGTDMKAAESTLSESKINNFTLHLMRSERPAFQKLRLCPGIMNSPERIAKDLAQIRKVAAHFEAEYFGADLSEEKCGSTAIECKINKIREGISQNIDTTSKHNESQPEDSNISHQENSTSGAQESDTKPSLPSTKSESIDKKALDLYVYYLRTVFNCCYYCVCVCDFQEELLRRCPKHVRKPACRLPDENSTTGTPTSHKRNGNTQSSTHLKSNEISWARTLDERVSLILNPSDVDPREFGGERVDDEIHRLCQPQITDEGAGKFRCKNCSKLFKAMNFIEKHIMTKHGEVINQESIERIKYLNNYILDPSHTTPQPPPPVDYGHPRSHNGISGSSGPHGMIPSMGPVGYGSEFHNGSYPPMMNNSIGAPAGMVMGGPYPGYLPAMYPPYPGHSYPPMGGPSAMFPNGPMLGAHGNGGHSHAYGGGGAYYMADMGPGAGGGYQASFATHHQIYSSLPAIPPPAHHGRPPNGNPRRLGDRISRHFADDNGFPITHHHDNNHKRSRRVPGDDLLSNRSHHHRLANGGGGITSGPGGPDLVPSDPRSKTVLAYNDLDTPAADEVVLNY